MLKWKIEENGGKWNHLYTLNPRGTSPFYLSIFAKFLAITFDMS